MTDAATRLRVPGILLLILCALNVLQILALGVVMVVDPGLRPTAATGDDVGLVVVLIAWFTSSLVATGLAAFGAYRMLQVRSYAWSLTAAMLALLPNVMIYCTPLSVPVAIWALVVLFNREVRSAFPGRHTVPDAFD